jgi:hypothetical protein
VSLIKRREDYNVTNDRFQAKETTDSQQATKIADRHPGTEQQELDSNQELPPAVTTQRDVKALREA